MEFPPGEVKEIRLDMISKMQISALKGQLAHWKRRFFTLVTSRSALFNALAPFAQKNVEIVLRSINASAVNMNLYLPTFFKIKHIILQ